MPASEAGPIIAASGAGGIAADGASFSVHEWRGSGPPHLHVHHEDDEAWHVLEGSLRFRFQDRTEEAAAGTTVFVPAGVAHSYEAAPGTRYLIILTPRLRSLIAELQGNRDRSLDPEIYRRHSSEIV
ncbi:MAG: cupin domain-containing protein [Candidatus Dormibacteraeota bacterium]|nr:cupin domain-containing protein [Candidatus Dormibacteraeota bacterium]